MKEFIREHTCLNTLLLLLSTSMSKRDLLLYAKVLIRRLHTNRGTCTLGIPQERHDYEKKTQPQKRRYRGKLMKKISSEIRVGQARGNGISVYDVKPSRNAVRGGRRVVYAICIRIIVCIHSTGKQTGNYLKRARGIRICSFARIIPRVLKSKQPRTSVVYCSAPLFKPRYFRERIGT